LINEEIGWWDREIDRLEDLIAYWRGENENREVDWDGDMDMDDGNEIGNVRGIGARGRDWGWDPSDEREIHFAREKWGRDLFP